MKREKLTRRQFMASAAIVAGSIALSACGATPTATPVPPTAVPPTATKPPAPTNTTAPAAPAATAAPAAPAAAPTVAPTVAPTKAPVPTTAPAANVVKGGKVTIAMWSSPGNFFPLNAPSSYAQFAIHIMFETLVKFNPKLEFEPRLAQSWTVSADKTVYTFKLNPNAKWHDGTTVTTDDVNFTFWLVTHPDVATNRGAYVSFIKGVDPKTSKRPAGVDTISGIKLIDKQTIEFTLQQPTDPQFALEALGVAQWIIPQAPLKDIKPADLEKNAFWAKPMGAGPFKFVQYQTDQFIELGRNDNYHLGKPNLDSIIIKILAPATMVAQLEKGELDMVAAGGIGDAPIDDWDKVKALTNVNAIAYDADGYQYALFNTKPGSRFADKAVRQAVITGVNRKLMVDQLLKGQGIIQNTPIIPSTPYYDKSVEGKWPYDAAKAKQMLAATKFDMNTPIKMYIPTGNVIRERHGDIITANLQDMGIKVNVQKLDFPSQIAQLKTGDFDIGYIGWGGPFDPDVSNQYHTGGQYNYGLWSNAAMDALLEKGAATADTEARKQVYKDFQALWIDELPVLPLYWQKRLGAINKRVQGASYMLGTNGLIRNVYEWWVSDGK
jgi:peptide/nickel transport system substrate-binding protein